MRQLTVCVMHEQNKSTTLYNQAVEEVLTFDRQVSKAYHVYGTKTTCICAHATIHSVTRVLMSLWKAAHEAL